MRLLRLIQALILLTRKKQMAAETTLKLIANNVVEIVSAGVDPTGVAGASAAILECCLYGRSLALDSNFGTTDSLARIAILYPAGGNVYIDATVSLALEGARLDFRCNDGKCNIIGDIAKTNNGFEFDRLTQTTWENLNFSGFDTATEWDTNNVDASQVRYINCDFIDNNKNVDTRNFADSRSTTLIFEDCRSIGVPRHVDSYCDQLIFRGGSYKNSDGTQAFVLANSKVSTYGGIWTPAANGAAARWFDLYNDSAQGSRGLETHSTRFGPENGGIPIVYNYMVGTTTATSRLTDSICFFGGVISSTDPVTKRGCIVLASNGSGSSIAPNVIKFCGANWRGLNGAVITELGEPVLSLTQGQFMIDLDQASQSRLGNTTINYAPMVESGLELYIAPYARLDKTQTVTSVGAVALDASLGEVIYINQASASTTDTINNAYDGQQITLIFRTVNTTIIDQSTSGDIHLSGGVDFVSSINDSLTLNWDRAGNKWEELSRSVN